MEFHGDEQVLSAHFRQALCTKNRLTVENEHFKLQMQRMKQFLSLLITPLTHVRWSVQRFGSGAS